MGWLCDSGSVEGAREKKLAGKTRDLQEFSRRDGGSKNDAGKRELRMLMTWSSHLVGSKQNRWLAGRKAEKVGVG